MNAEPEQGRGPAASPATRSRDRHRSVVPLRALPVERPLFRRLHAFAFDPSLALRFESRIVNDVIIQVPWEWDPSTGRDILGAGPVGEYLEVVDVDPPSHCYYAPVDLNDPHLLAQDGLEPLETNPQFHQQMVYAVAMTTIGHFEHALGRRIHWVPRFVQDQRAPRTEYVQRLRIYPHALRDLNAYYSPAKRALLFGYSFEPNAGSWIFTCLSHDVVAHEMTHAIVAGLQLRFLEPTNSDVLAFHEAFSDIVALFQHFSFPEVVRHQIAQTRGDLATENLLAQLAQEIGEAAGLHGALRDALGAVDDEGHWRRREPSSGYLTRTTEPHARGAILVAAIFDAFLLIYRSRITDLLRMATGGTGVLPAGELLPDLVNRLSQEAAGAAQYMLERCILALDYCPPVDLTFGDFLRALITADFDLSPLDPLRYRVAIVAALKQWGIRARGWSGMSVQGLRWTPPVLSERAGQSEKDFMVEFAPVVRALRGYAEDQIAIGERERLWLAAQEAAARIGRELAMLPDWVFEALGLEVQAMRAEIRSFEVHPIQIARRIDRDGRPFTDAIVQITQRRPAYLAPELQQVVDSEQTSGPVPPVPDFWFRGGCTLMINLQNGKVRYAITKSLNDRQRLAEQRAFIAGPGSEEEATGQAALSALYFGEALDQTAREPFALLHATR